MWVKHAWYSPKQLTCALLCCEKLRWAVCRTLGIFVTDGRKYQTGLIFVVHDTSERSDKNPEYQFPRTLGFLSYVNWHEQWQVCVQHLIMQMGLTIKLIKFSNNTYLLWLSLSVNGRGLGSWKSQLPTKNELFTHLSIITEQIFKRIIVCP
jgi:hypothetical protein